MAAVYNKQPEKQQLENLMWPELLQHRRSQMQGPGHTDQARSRPSALQQLAGDLDQVALERRQVLTPDQHRFAGTRRCAGQVADALGGFRAAHRACVRVIDAPVPCSGDPQLLQRGSRRAARVPARDARLGQQHNVGPRTCKQNRGACVSSIRGLHSAFNVICAPDREHLTCSGRG
jgi:hypothetical protein